MSEWARERERTELILAGKSSLERYQQLFIIIIFLDSKDDWNKKNCWQHKNVLFTHNSFILDAVVLPFFCELFFLLFFIFISQQCWQIVELTAFVCYCFFVFLLHFGSCDTWLEFVLQLYWWICRKCFYDCSRLERFWAKGAVLWVYCLLVNTFW